MLGFNNINNRLALVASQTMMVVRNCICVKWYKNGKISAHKIAIVQLRSHNTRTHTENTKWQNANKVNKR